MTSGVQYPLGKAGVVELLQRYGIMPTQQRIDIAHFLFQQPQHLSAEAILDGVNTRRERVSKATVYNTLGLFVRKGLVREVLIDPERVFYDSNTRPHHHIYNLDTGELSDVQAGSVRVQELPVLPQGTEVDSLDVVIRVRNVR
ncbi:MAG: transcriptional repressor [Gammaproteobacteria bacterium]|nr:transcriptional repressor [Gammaproteobacteria bacterium]